MGNRRTEKFAAWLGIGKHGPSSTLYMVVARTADLKMYLPNVHVEHFHESQ